MRSKSVAWTLAVGLMVGFLIPGQAVSAKQKPQTELIQNESFNLGDVRSFGIYDMPRHDFAASRQANVPAEVVEYTRTALQNDNRIQYASPAQGMLHFYCDDNLCTRLKVELTQGTDGPVLWRTVQNYWMWPWREIQLAPNTRKFAEKIVNLLVDDYQKTVTAVPEKIQIRED